MYKYSIIIPVYNEELVIAELYQRLKKTMSDLNDEYEVIFINDGSSDASYNLIKDICEKDANVKLLNFSRNFGHQIAISAGLDFSDGDAVVIMDADLQDPPELIPEMISKWKEGFDIIYARRIKRKGETLFKRITAHLFYRLLKGITNCDIPVDTGDFRLIDKKVCKSINKLHEKSRYVRGLISWLGFKFTFIDYVRDERFAGETRYPVGKMIKFALDAITSFSYKPLTIASYFGFFLSGISFLYLLFVIYEKLFTNNTVLGWTSVIAVSLLFNGIILVILGVMGEYIGRIYEEVKGRPLYVLRDQIGFKANNQ